MESELPGCWFFSWAGKGVLPKGQVWWWERKSDSGLLHKPGNLKVKLISALFPWLNVIALVSQLENTALALPCGNG